MADRWERDTPCQDASGRDRLLRVFLTENNDIGLLAPPGEVATVRREQVHNLQQLLTGAVIEAAHREAERGSEPNAD